MANIARYTATQLNLDVVEIFDDFTADQSDLFFVDTITDTGTALVGDEVNGVMTLTPSDGTVADNDEVYIASSNEIFLFGTNREIYGKCRLRWTETAAGVYNVGFGFMNAVGADSLIDNGGGPKVSGSTLAIYKVDGGSVWRVASACNGVSTVTVSDRAAVGSTWYELEIIAKDWDGVSMQVYFYVDGTPLKDTTGNVIKHTVAIASATEMSVWAGAKLGAATNNDTTKIDFILGQQTRV
jgi:hypothetical protein